MLRLPTKSCLLEVVAANRRLQYPPVPQSRATFSGPSFGFPFRACHANRMLLGNGKIQQSVANTLSNGEVKTSILLQIRKGGLEFDKTPLLWRMNALYGCFSTNKSDLVHAANQCRSGSGRFLMNSATQVGWSVLSGNLTISLGRDHCSVDTRCRISARIEPARQARCKRTTMPFTV